jgi:hypothetical protein
MGKVSAGWRTLQTARFLLETDDGTGTLLPAHQIAAG